VLKAREKRCAFSLDLNWPKDWEDLTDKWRLFHSLGAATEKALPPLVFSLALGTANRSWFWVEHWGQQWVGFSYGTLDIFMSTAKPAKRQVPFVSTEHKNSFYNKVELDHEELLLSFIHQWLLVGHIWAVAVLCLYMTWLLATLTYHTGSKCFNQTIFW